MIKYKKTIDKLIEYVPGKPINEVKKELGLENVVKLASNENPLGCSPKAKEAMMKCFDEVNLYPDGSCTDLRRVLSKKLNVNENQILFGCGTDEVISNIVQAFVEEGDEVITAQTTFSQYENSVCAIGGTMVFTPMKNHGFDLKAICDAITPKTKMIFIANPNNPTGTLVGASEQLEFIKSIPSNVIIVFDEAYYEYVVAGNYLQTIPLIEQHSNVIVLRTFSKVYGLASLRVGYGIMNSEIVSAINRLRKPFNVNTLAQAAALVSLEDCAFIENSVASNNAVREYSYGKLKDMKLSYIPTHANFIMLDTGKDSIDVFQHLLKRGFIIRPGKAFDMPTYIRVTFGTMEQMKAFFVELEKII